MTSSLTVRQVADRCESVFDAAAALAQEFKRSKQEGLSPCSPRYRDLWRSLHALRNAPKNVDSRCDPTLHTLTRLASCLTRIRDSLRGSERQALRTLPALFNGPGQPALPDRRFSAPAFDTELAGIAKSGRDAIRILRQWIDESDPQTAFAMGADVEPTPAYRQIPAPHIEIAGPLLERARNGLRRCQKVLEQTIGRNRDFVSYRVQVLIPGVRVETLESPYVRESRNVGERSLGSIRVTYRHAPPLASELYFLVNFVRSVQSDEVDPATLGTLREIAELAGIVSNREADAADWLNFAHGLGWVSPPALGYKASRFVPHELSERSEWNDFIPRAQFQGDSIPAMFNYVGSIEGVQEPAMFVSRLTDTLRAASLAIEATLDGSIVFVPIESPWRRPQGQPLPDAEIAALRERLIRERGLCIDYFESTRGRLLENFGYACRSASHDAVSPEPDPPSKADNRSADEQIEDRARTTQRIPRNVLSPETREARRDKWLTLRTRQADAIRQGKKLTDKAACEQFRIGKEEFYRLRKNAIDNDWPDPKIEAQMQRRNDRECE